MTSDSVTAGCAHLTGVADCCAQFLVEIPIEFRDGTSGRGFRQLFDILHAIVPRSKQTFVGGRRRQLNRLSSVYQIKSAHLFFLAGESIITNSLQLFEVDNAQHVVEEPHFELEVNWCIGCHTRTPVDLEQPGLELTVE